MLRIKDTLVSLDLIERCFICNTDSCRGDCCIEGDAGAPLEKEEFDLLRRILPIVWDDLSAEARELIQKQGVGYVDVEGDIVTSIVKRKACVFVYYDAEKICRCAIEKAYREGRTGFMKPVSCHLYPIRITKYQSYTAVNYDRWKICRAAEIMGETTKMPLYRFLREPLIRKFGQEWYDELDFCAQEYLRQKRGHIL